MLRPTCTVWTGQSRSKRRSALPRVFFELAARPKRIGRAQSALVVGRVCWCARAADPGRFGRVMQPRSKRSDTLDVAGFARSGQARAKRGARSEHSERALGASESGPVRSREWFEAPTRPDHAKCVERAASIETNWHRSTEKVASLFSGFLFFVLSQQATFCPLFVFCAFS